MKIETTRFGTLEIEDTDIITFPQGMLGFSKIHEYVLVERDDDSLFCWLQALKRGTVAFPLLEPQIFELRYEVELEEEDQKILRLDDLQHAKVFSIITIPSDPTKMTANLLAPIVVNVKEQLAKQVILHNADYPIRKSVFADLQRYCNQHERPVFSNAQEPASYHPVPLGRHLEGARGDLPL